MAETPEVSVIIPMYNAEKYIQRCVDSVLKQTFNSFEILIVDDASTDASFSLCRKFYGHEPKVQLLTHNPPCNFGVAHSRNLGLRMARGKYITFIDNDDIVAPKYLERMYDVAEEHQAEVVELGYTDVIEGKERPVHFTTDKAWLPDDRRSRWDILMSNHITWVVWAHLYRRDFLASNDIYFHEVGGEDLLFNFVSLWYAKQHIVLPNTDLYFYCQTSTSLGRGNNPKQVWRGIDAEVRGMRIVEDYISAWPNLANDSELSNHVRELFFGAFLRGAIDICKKYPEDWKEIMHTTFMNLCGVDAIWVDLLQRNFFVFTDRVAQVEKENQQLAAQNVALRRYIEDVQGKGDLA